MAEDRANNNILKVVDCRKGIVTAAITLEGCTRRELLALRRWAGFFGVPKKRDHSRWYQRNAFLAQTLGIEPGSNLIVFAVEHPASVIEYVIRQGLVLLRNPELEPIAVEK